jgi:16S rRNA (adenine1518-N6/adenine1519-N6)-dimethyltransferase
VIFMFHPRKQFGQHWLKSEKALAKILQAANLQADDRILEIGPGTGILTTQLLALVRSLVAIEIDRDLCVGLRQKFGAAILDQKLELIEGDILSMPLPVVCNKVVANIPYNITSPILEKLLGSISQPVGQFEQIVLLVQKEIGDRMVAKAGHKAYGAMSVRVQYLAECHFICDVPAKAFMPPPKVDSAVVCLMPRTPLLPASDPKFLETLIKLGFATKRKMLRNNLGSIVERDRLVNILESSQINPQVRAEDLSLEQWIALSELLKCELLKCELLKCELLSPVNHPVNPSA